MPGSFKERSLTTFQLEVFLGTAGSDDVCAEAALRLQVLLAGLLVQTMGSLETLLRSERTDHLTCFSTVDMLKISKYQNPRLKQELRSASVRSTKPLLSAATAGPTTL